MSVAASRFMDLRTFLRSAGPRTAPGVHAVVAANIERRCESPVCGIRPGQRVHHGDHVTAVRDGLIIVTCLRYRVHWAPLAGLCVGTSGQSVVQVAPVRSPPSPSPFDPNSDVLGPPSLDAVVDLRILSRHGPSHSCASRRSRSARRPYLVAFVIVITATVSACCAFAAPAASWGYLVTSPCLRRCQQHDRGRASAAIPSRLLSATFTSNWSTPRSSCCCPIGCDVHHNPYRWEWCRRRSAGGDGHCGDHHHEERDSQAGRRIPGRRSLVLRHWK